MGLQRAEFTRRSSSLERKPSTGANAKRTSSKETSPMRSDVFLSSWHLKFLNRQLSQLPPDDILRWCLVSLPGLYQETAFGLSGMVILDKLTKLNSPRGTNNVPLLFLDTLHHFSETEDLVARVQSRYPAIPVLKYGPMGASTADEFAELHGAKLWETNEELYDWHAKVEPARRAYAELNIKAVLTGRRRAQGGGRGALDIIEVDESGLIKVNPLLNWSFAQVRDYIRENDVPYNALLDRGYKSIGDWHSTSPVADAEGERDGRWKGKEKTECGIHNPASRYFQLLMQQQRAQGNAATLQTAPTIAAA